ncbi:MAG: diacylglycerol/lipid kinase family protein [Lacibacter sp.]
MPQYLFLINPQAGNRQGGRLAGIITRYCSRRGISFHIQDTPADGNYQPIAAAITATDITHVIVCGGDGTISAAVSALRHLPVYFGIIPLGSGNGLALAAGIPRNSRKALDIIFRNHTIAADAVQVNGYFSCMLTGLGFDAQVAHLFDRQQRRGFWKYAQLTFRHFWHMRPYRVTLQTDEGPLRVTALMVCVATANQFGNHFTIAPRAQLTDGKMDVVVLLHGNRLQFLVRVLRQLFLGRPGPFNKAVQGIHYFQCRRILIENTEGAPLHVDGDGKPTALTLPCEVLPGAYRLLVP